MKYQHIWKAILDRPWAILPVTLQAIIEVVELRAEGSRLSAEDVQERLDVAATQNGARRGAQRRGLVAVLPVYGVLSPRQNLMSETSGGTSYDKLAEAFREVMADPEIGSVVLDVDSPGGSVEGLDELASEIRAARGQKPIVAVADTMMASAALWLGAQADEIVASPTALVGSVGVISAHADMSAAYEKLGVKNTLITSSKYKAEGNEFEPLGDEARDEIQRLVDHYGGMFESALARGRGLSVDVIRKDFGQGRVMTPKQAMDVRMIDRVDTLDATIRRLGRGNVPAGKPDTDRAEAPAGLPFAEHAERVLLDVTALARRAGEIRTMRAEEGRDLSAARREELDAIAAQLLEVHGSVAALLIPPAVPRSRGRLLELMEAAQRGGYQLTSS